MGRAGARPGVVVVIPAALASSRLPRKMLLSESGRALILHTCDRANQARLVDRVMVATDSVEIRKVVEAEGIEAAMTSADARTGTDRIAEVARGLIEPYIINLQGDEPEIAPDDIDRVAECLRQGAAADIVTLAQPVRDAAEWSDPNTVKVVIGGDGRALYFSRASVPRPKREDHGDPALRFKHVGIYGFSREKLLEFATLSRSRLELHEGLEQLRALDHGWTVRVLESSRDTRGINAREDYDRFVDAMRRDSGVTG